MPSTTMPSSSILVIQPERFSDELLATIINAVALSGDSPIAQITRIICSMRKTHLSIESEVSKLRRDAYIRSLCRDLYEEMVHEGMIDSQGWLDLDKLRLLFRTQRNRAILEKQMIG